VKFLLGIFLLALALTMSGCADNEPENLSERPWNAPNGWEGGMPAGMLQQQQQMH
jgi:hypothetical protein